MVCIKNLTNYKSRVIQIIGYKRNLYQKIINVITFFFQNTYLFGNRWEGKKLLEKIHSINVKIFVLSQGFFLFASYDKILFRSNCVELKLTYNFHTLSFVAKLFEMDAYNLCSFLNFNTFIYFNWSYEIKMCMHKQKICISL